MAQRAPFLERIGRVPTISPATVISLPLRWPSISFEREGADIFQARGIFFERVAGDIEAQHGVFAGEALFLAPGRGFSQLEVDFGFGGGPAEKQPVLAGFFGAGGTLNAVNSLVHGGKHAFARAERIDGAGLDEAFKDALVQETGFDALAEFIERFEFALADAGFADGFGGVFANVLDGRETKANGIADGREIEVALIHVGGKDGDAHAAGFVDVLDDFFRVAGFGGEQRGHEFDGIVRFQIGGLIGEQRVGAGVRLIEAVAGEFFHQVEDAHGFLFGDFVFLAAGQEFGALRGHLFFFLLAHGAAEQVCFAEREAGQAVGDLHDLFLIEDDAVGFLENFFQLREFVGDFGFAVFAIDEVVDHAALDGAGAVEGVEGGKVLDARGLIAAENVAHAVGFKLEDGGGVAAREEFVGGFVVEREIVDVELDAAILLPPF